jgi:predicted membrane channel-forming protein YqfA (hemolysin III family)
MGKERQTSWQGWLFLASWVLIILAAVVYGVSEYTVDPHKGQVQENWSIVIFVTGLVALLASRAAAK